MRIRIIEIEPGEREFTFGHLALKEAVEQYAGEMLERLYDLEDEGKTGWEDPALYSTIMVDAAADLAAVGASYQEGYLPEQITLVDIGARVMMLYNQGRQGPKPEHWPAHMRRHGYYDQ